MKQELFNELKEEVDLIRRSSLNLKDDSAFVLWFLRAVIADSEEQAKNALTGDTSDKGIDAVLIDHRMKQVNIVQGKFRTTLGEHAEKRNDVLEFARLSLLPWENKEVIRSFYDKMDPLVHQKLEEALNYIRNKEYSLRLFYVTTGKCSAVIRSEASEIVNQGQSSVEIIIEDGASVITTFKDYLEGVAPAVPTLTLRIASEGPIQTEGVLHRFDAVKKIESWVFSMSAEDVGELYEKAGIRLFARNVRGYLGDTDINDSMTETIKEQPENFWYYNNGVTIVCDGAEQKVQGGQSFLRVERPQLINGQQTTRTLSKQSSPKASVLVKVIRVSRDEEDENQYEDLVSAIVRATNWQNAVLPSDLVSNDSKQVFLERELRKLGYQYIRKRQSKSEARMSFGSRTYLQIKKDEMARAIAACDFDSAALRQGKEHLFEDPYYKSIFSSRSIQYYLSRYWLMKATQMSSRGYPERSYAKWLVLHFAWKNLYQLIGSGIGERKFRYASEHSGQKSYELYNLLQSILVGIFKAALAFYRLERGSGEEAKDVSSFFRIFKLDEKFEKFWNSGKNVQKSKVEKSIVKFKKALIEFDGI